MNHELPLITIGVSAYNRADFLPECLDSLLAQTYPNCEIIVVDDGSTDNTAQIMAERYPQIKYIRKENGGDASAKNRAAAAAAGEYIVFNDSDDVFLPDAVARLYETVKGKTNACSYGGYITIDKDGNRLPTKSKVATLPSGRITETLIRHIVVNNCGTLLPLHAYRAAQGFDEKLKNSYDYKLMLTLSAAMDFYAVEEPVFLRRRHGNNLSAASYDKLKNVLEILTGFLAEHPEIHAKYAASVKKRLAALHSKLAREAKKEKRSAEQKYHSAEAYKHAKTIKNLFRLIGAYWRF